MENRLFLLTTYLIVRQHLDAQVNCTGSKELIKIDIQQAPQIVGLIKFNGHLVPVVDLSVSCHNLKTKITDLSCLLIINHNCPKGKKTPIAILLDGFDDILAISSGEIVMSNNIKLGRNLKQLTQMTSSLQGSSIFDETVKEFQTYLFENSWDNCGSKIFDDELTTANI